MRKVHSRSAQLHNARQLLEGAIQALEIRLRGIKLHNSEVVVCPVWRVAGSLRNEAG